MVSEFFRLNNNSRKITILWCMRAFVEGSDGVLPWQGLGDSKAFIIPDKNALIVDTREVLNIDWVVSLRVKALRRCQQNVELMTILEKKYSYKREQIRDFFYRYFNDENINTNKMEHFREILIENQSPTS